MKILLLFIDMVRCDHLSVYNPNTKEVFLDKNLKSLGGTLFTQCYSPSPDTPRSLACFMTGLNPHFNGCDTRIKWPKFYIKPGISTIFDHAVNNGYNVNLCVRQSYIDTGIFKYEDHQKICVFTNVDEFISGSKITDDTLCFLGTPDNHLAVDDYGATEKALKKGDSVVNDLFTKLKNTSFFKKFDYVFIFSDHGLLLESEWRKSKNKLDLLNDGRTKLLMFCHKAGDKGIRNDNRLASMLDYYATIEDLIGCSDYRQGYSFMHNAQRKILHIEDHDSFKVSPELMVTQWRIISEGFDIRTNVSKTEEINGQNYDQNIVDNYLSEVSPTYPEYVKQMHILDLYAKLKGGNPDSYFVGGRRLNKKISFLRKAFLRIVRIVYQKLY